MDVGYPRDHPRQARVFMRSNSLAFNSDPKDRTDSSAKALILIRET